MVRKTSAVWLLGALLAIDALALPTRVQPRPCD